MFGDLNRRPSFTEMPTCSQTIARRQALFARLALPLILVWIVGCVTMEKNEASTPKTAFLLDRAKGSPSIGTILLIHGSAPFNGEGRIPIETNSKYSKIPFYKGLASALNHRGWDVARYSKPGVTDHGIDFNQYKQTDLKLILDQLQHIWTELPHNKPLVVFAWSEGSLHATQLPLSQASAVILLGGIATNIRDVIVAQATLEGTAEKTHAELQSLLLAPREDMLGIDRPVGRLIDELHLQDNWRYLEPFPELPILILHGEADGEVPVQQALLWQTRLPKHRITLRLRPSGNHMFGVGDSADPEGLADEIQRWLKEVL